MAETVLTHTSEYPVKDFTTAQKTHLRGLIELQIPEQSARISDGQTTVFVPDITYARLLSPDIPSYHYPLEMEHVVFRCFCKFQ